MYILYIVFMWRERNPLRERNLSYSGSKCLRLQEIRKGAGENRVWPWISTSDTCPFGVDVVVIVYLRSHEPRKLLRFYVLRNRASFWQLPACLRVVICAGNWRETTQQCWTLREVRTVDLVRLKTRDKWLKVSHDAGSPLIHDVIVHLYRFDCDAIYISL